MRPQRGARTLACSVHTRVNAVKAVFLIAVVAPILLAQQPRVDSARFETRQVSGSLEATLRSILNAQSSPAWVGYAVPIVPGDHQSCCWNDNQRGCFLEPHTNSQTVAIAPNQPVKLEGPTHLVVLFRIDVHQIVKVRTFTPECELDAGGLPFVWLTGADASDSIRFLLTLAKDTAGGSRDQLRKADTAVSAIALHADPAADSALEELAGPTQPDQVRRQAIFWLGNARGRRGFEVVSRILQQDPSDTLRERAVFALMESKEPEAVNAVIRAAHNDKSPRVRGQALFWLAQRAGQKTAESAISDAIANDPETEVKKKAVFALTQMPAGEGVPILIQVARDNRSPAVRKQAMFWLGQSKDPRALNFIEELLK
jgi:HEAT repeat protein